MVRILLVEDDTDINQMTAEYLSGKGYEVEQAFSGTEGRRLFLQNADRGYDLILMDLMLPGISGEELLHTVRQHSRIPVIVLSARNALNDKVDLLGNGADDYLTKPFELAELEMRIQVQLRHAGTPAGTLPEGIRYKDWEVDTSALCLRVRGMPVELTVHEFGIVELLVRRPKKVFTKQEIYEAVWQQDYAIEDKTIHVHISNIRSKLKKSGTADYIQTVWGIGFKMAE